MGIPCQFNNHSTSLNIFVYNLVYGKLSTSHSISENFCTNQWYIFCVMTLQVSDYLHLEQKFVLKAHYLTSNVYSI